MRISGEWAQSNSEECFEIRNPATSESLGWVPKGTREDVEKAIEAAMSAFEVWSKFDSRSRAKILIQGSELVRSHKDELAVMLTKENGKPLRESKAEIEAFSSEIEYCANLIRVGTGEYIPISEAAERLAVVVYEPFGVCGAITPWNAPVWSPARVIAPCLAAGNSLVIKPASATPLTLLSCAELLDKVGLPKGTLNVVTGPATTVGSELLENPNIKKITFIGDTDTGKHVLEVASRHIKRVTLELGGNDAMIVCDDANLDDAVEGALRGRFALTGQGCVAVKRLYLFERIADTFIAKFLDRVKKIVVGNGLRPDTIMGPLISSSAREAVESQVADALEKGGEVLAGGTRPKGPEFDVGFFYMPTVMVNVPETARLIAEECFGPVLPIFLTKSVDEAVHSANRSRYGLGASVWTTDLRRAWNAAFQLQSGVVWINSCRDEPPEIPFGGIKESGLGRAGSERALDHYRESKVIMFDLSPKKPWF
jgi:succinate-semialdehyde dehydrogenase/glutarate-semialdehyde dehydrogenase